MLSIGEIKREFQAASVEELPEIIKRYETDQRSGVRQLAENAGKKLAALEKEKERIEALRSYEKKYGEYELICGIDEAALCERIAECWNTARCACAPHRETSQ